MSMFAPLAKISVVERFIASLRVGRSLDVQSGPLFKSIRDPAHVCLIRLWSGSISAQPAELAQHSRIVRATLVQSYSDGNVLARPLASSASVVLASESSHNLGVVILDASRIVVLVVKAVRKTDGLQIP